MREAREERICRRQEKRREMKKGIEDDGEEGGGRPEKRLETREVGDAREGAGDKRWGRRREKGQETKEEAGVQKRDGK